MLLYHRIRVDTVSQTVHVSCQRHWQQAIPSIAVASMKLKSFVSLLFTSKPCNYSGIRWASVTNVQVTYGYLSWTPLTPFAYNSAWPFLWVIYEQRVSIQITQRYFVSEIRWRSVDFLKDCRRVSRSKGHKFFNFKSIHRRTTANDHIWLTWADK